jgi:cytochrome c peroxidase
MKKISTAAVIALFVFLFSCKDKKTIPQYMQDDLHTSIAAGSPNGTAEFYILPESDDYANIPQDPRNPLSAEKIELGRMLFFEPGIATEAKHGAGAFTYSCGSCHVPEAGFRPGRPQGIADGAYGFGYEGDGRFIHSDYQPSDVDAQGARPLVLLNVAFVTNTMWNGSFGPKGVNVGTENVWGVSDPGTLSNHRGYEALEAQNIEGLKTHRQVINENTLSTFGYKEYFDRIFSQIPKEDRYTRETASLAISAYLRSITTTKAPFQEWLKGDSDALSIEEMRGALLFFGKAGCNRCHYEKNLGSMEFKALGVKDLYQTTDAARTGPNDRRNLGRGGFTYKPEDMFKFRVPQLYNLADGPFYFHGASKRTLDEVLDYFNQGIPENPNVPKDQISSYFTPLHLNPDEITDLKSFIENGLNDPDLLRFKPERVLSGMCFPNNDKNSKVDMGCN